VHDTREAPFGRRLDQRLGRDRRELQIAPKQVTVGVRKHEEVAGSELHRGTGAGQPRATASFRHQMIDRDVLGVRQNLQQILLAGGGIDAPGCGEFRFEENSAGQSEGLEQFG
jgi:hypothetical protein